MTSLHLKLDLASPSFFSSAEIRLRARRPDAVPRPDGRLRVRADGLSAGPGRVAQGRPAAAARPPDEGDAVRHAGDLRHPVVGSRPLPVQRLQRGLQQDEPDRRAQDQPRHL